MSSIYLDEDGMIDECKFVVTRKWVLNSKGDDKGLCAIANAGTACFIYHGLDHLLKDKKVWVTKDRIYFTYEGKYYEHWLTISERLWVANFDRWKRGETKVIPKGRTFTLRSLHAVEKKPRSDIGTTRDRSNNGPGGHTRSLRTPLPKRQHEYAG